MSVQPVRVSLPFVSRLSRLFVVIAMVAASFVVIGGFNPPAASAAPCDAPVVNKVACENLQPGSDDWKVQSKDEAIVGFTTDISTTPGSQVDFKIRTAAKKYHIDIYRLGYYQDKGARYMGTVYRTQPQNQPECLRDAATALIDCGNWAVSVSWTVPSTAVSGVYYAKLHDDDLAAGNDPNDPNASEKWIEHEIVFIVRDDASNSKILFQTSDSTWAAYNRYGGNSLYFGDGPGQGGQAYKVSYNRPFTGGDGPEDFVFNAEYPMLKFMERNGYDMSYTTDADSARRGNLIKNHKVFLAVGHDEYWSSEQRNNVEAARDAGVHMAFMTGNEIFWKTKWEPSTASGTSTDWRTVVCYKETKGTQNDGTNTWTGTWRDPRYSPPQDGGRPENSLLGNIFTVNGHRNDSLEVPSAFGKTRLWRNTAVANLAAGAKYTFQPGTLGYEWNTVPDNGFQPAGVMQMSQTTVGLDGAYALHNYGDDYGSGTETHALTMYRAPSGALVFGAGTVQWAWGLEDEHASSTTTPSSDRNMQQATVNLFADMGVQPATRMTELVAATGSTDSTAPAVAITNVPAQPTVGAAYTFSGTVTDNAKVGGVEISTDAGATWHPANWTMGATTWSYTYTPPASGAAGLRARAVDDSANLSAPAQANPNVVARTCPCGVWPSAATPVNADNADTSPLELGVKWRANTAGYVRGVKFYKGAGNTGTHTGSLWSTTGQLMATGTFTNETATGWQTLVFPSPVAVAGNTTYIVSYYSPSGHFAGDTEYFSRKATYLEPLTGLRTGTDGPNGVFTSGAGFPNRSSGDTNYWVDVLWAPDPGPDTRAPGLMTTNPATGATSVPLTPTIQANFDERIAPTSVQFQLTGPGGAVIAGTSAVSADGLRVSLTPSANLSPSTSYTASLTVKDAANNTAGPVTWSFTTGALRPATCPCTVWEDFAKPGTESALDDSAVELGTKVRFDGKGEVLGVRFYKGIGNSGTHTGSLWSSTGLLLATGTFTGESASGWQKLTFSAPVVVQANTTYIVSYFAPKGRYAVDGGYFSGHTASYGALHALAGGTDGPNGLYRYGAGGAFPNSSYNSANYWVDVVFRNGLNGDTTPPALTTHVPATNATNVGLSAPLTATFSEAVDPASTQAWLTDPGGAKLTGTVSLSGDQKTVTWTPRGALKPATAYTATVQIADVNGNAMAAPVSWSFTTTSTPTCPCSLFSTATEPAVASADDNGAYELGIRLTPSVSGTINGVRFYKSTENTGTHSGSLWSSTGQKLATGTFTGESASGWQTLTFTNPVVVQAGVMYTASYTTTTGHYSINQGYFQATAVNSPPLSAPATSDISPNGVFTTGTGFPTSSYGGNNYWVDVVYNPSSDTIPPAVTDQTPQNGASELPLNTTVSTTFDDAVDLATAQFSLLDKGGAKLAGTLSLSGNQRTVSWTPAAPLSAGTTYTASMRVADLNGNMMAAPLVWNFTTTVTGTCPCSLFSAATVPTTTSADDNGAYELGVRVTPTTGGTITGVRFYKGTGNTGTHTGSLWTDSGQLLATGTFSGETATGWQTLTFTSPVAVTSGTTYVASYTTTTGHYAVDQGYFQAGAVTSPPLSSPATSETSPNGVYQVGSGFPTNSYGGNNYWVDVVFN